MHRLETSGGSCEHGNVPSSSIKDDFLTEVLSAPQEGLYCMKSVSFHTVLLLCI
jgi:hypothetical protein